MPLVLGLGNPGARYARTRHNAGFRVVDLLVDRWKASPSEATAAYRTWRAELAWGGVDLMVPLTFMNRSGEAIAEWRARHDLDPADLLVITDDVYLPVGALRLRAQGSSGGHRGLESLESTLETRAFARLRVGVGAIDAANLKDHVLEAVSRDEEEAFEASLASAVDAVECWANEGILAAMNRFNRRVRKEESAS